MLGKTELRSGRSARKCRKPSTHLALHYHLGFSTKDRKPWLAPTPRQRAYEYLGGIIRGMHGMPHAVGGTGDHVHFLAGLGATLCLADVMRELKSDSSAWIHKTLGFAGFAWQEGPSRAPAGALVSFLKLTGGSASLHHRLPSSQASGLANPCLTELKAGANEAGVTGRSRWGKD